VVEPTGAAIAGAIERLFQDPDEAKRLGEAGREAASSITWTRAVDTVVDALEGVMAR
jgi:hypothetical protein